LDLRNSLRGLDQVIVLVHWGLPTLRSDRLFRLGGYRLRIAQGSEYNQTRIPLWFNDLEVGWESLLRPAQAIELLDLIKREASANRLAKASRLSRLSQWPGERQARCDHP